jgi:hypothetical protein
LSFLSKTNEAKAQEIKKAFFEYAKHNELSAFDTPCYFTRQILPDESFFLKAKVIEDLMESKVMVMRGKNGLLKNEVTKTATMASLLQVLQLLSD